MCVSFHFEQTSEVALGGICYLWTESDWLFAPVSRLYIEVSKQTMAVRFIPCPHSLERHCSVTVTWQSSIAWGSTALTEGISQNLNYSDSRTGRIYWSNKKWPHSFKISTLATRSKTHCIHLRAIQTRQSADEKNSHQIRGTLDLFLSDSHFGFGPVWEVKRTAGELSGNSRAECCHFERVPLINSLHSGNAEE